MALRVLGTLELRSATGTSAALGGPTPKALLARLTIAGGQVLSTDRLIDDLWQDRPPRTASTALRVHVSHLRHALAAAGGAGASSCLVHRSGGYALDLPASAVDAEQFTVSVTDARAAASVGRLDEAVAGVDDALGWWRGPAYADLVAWPFAAAEATRLEQDRLRAVEEQLGWRLALGQHSELLGELARLVSDHPLRERLWALRMVALYRCGLQVDALRSYQEARLHLINQVGVEPGPELQDLERSILDQDPTLLLPARPHGDVTVGPRAAAVLPSALARPAAQPLAGRKSELQRLLDELTACRRGSLRLVTVEGEPGIGKTRLAAEVAQRATAAEVTALYGRCDQETIGSYQPFVEALQGYAAQVAPEVLRVDLGRAGPELFRVMPQLHHHVLATPAAVIGDPDGDRYRLFESFLAVVAAAATRTPVVLILDDLHWADRSTLLLLRKLLRLPTTTPLLIVATLRSTETGDAMLQDVLAGAHRDCPVLRLQLDGLEVSGIEDLMAAVVGKRLGAELASELRHRTGGNPLFLTELSGAVAARASAPEEEGASPLPASIADSIAHRLRRLSPATRRWLDAAAVGGEQHHAPTVARALGLTEEELLESLEETLAAQLVAAIPAAPETYRFVHALIRDALYDNIEQSRRARLHRDIGHVIEQTGSDNRATQVAHHLLVAARAGVGKGPVAAAWALRAADEAMGQLSYESAVTLLADAVALPGVDTEADLTCDLLLRWGEAAYRAGDLQASRDRFRQAAEGARGHAPEALAQAAVGYCSVSELGMAGIPDDTSFQLLEQAAQRNAGAPTQLRVQVLSRLARELHYRQDRTRCLELSSQVVDMAAELDDPRCDAIALYNRRWRFADPAELDAQVQRSTHVLQRLGTDGASETRFLTHRFRVGALLEAGDTTGARREVELCRALAASLRQPLYAGQVRRFDIMVALLDGTFDRARSLIKAALADDSTHDHSGVANQLVVLWWLTGGLEAVTDAAAQAIDERPWLPVYRAAAALLDAELGRTRTGQAHFDHCLAHVVPGLPDDENWLLTLVLLAYASIHLDRPDTTGRLRTLLRPHATRTVVMGGGDACLGSAGLAHAALTARIGDTDVATTELEAALEHNEDLGARPFVVLTRLELGRTLLHHDGARNRSRAPGVLEDTLAEARHLGMPPTVERASALLAAARVAAQ